MSQVQHHPKFEDALGALLLGQPFFGTLLMKLKHVPDPALDPPTMAVGNSQIRYHPDFVEKMDIDEIVFGLAHEVMHVAWQHLPRMIHYSRMGIGPDGKEMDWDRYNRAADYPINDGLVKAGIGKPIDKSKMQICLDPKFPETMTPEEVYCLLPPSDSDKGKGMPGPMDGHDHQQGTDDPNAITPADIIQAANIHKAVRGELPGMVERIIGELRRPDQSPWAILRNFVTSNLPGHDRSSWKRLQRKYAVRGIGMPGRVSMGAGRVGVVIDTSGSIGQDMLNLFASHMGAIITDAMPRDVKIYWVDAKLHRVDDAKNVTDLRRILSKKIPGGGGTDMRIGVAAAEKDKCDSIVVLTDGYTPFCDSKKPLMWAITSDVKAEGNGRTISI